MCWYDIVNIFLFSELNLYHLGVSGKSVLLYAIVFTCRYLDLFLNYISLYNSIMKVVYLASTYLTIYLIYIKFKSTYDRNHDSFRIELLLLPTAALAFIWNHEFSVLEV
jgi:ER lumen protein retaining receptor